MSQEFSKKCLKLIGLSTFDFQCDDSEIRSQEMPVGNFFADVIRLALNADATFVNSGAIRVSGKSTASQINSEEEAFKVHQH